MAQRVQVILEDDHDGGIADETIEFALDGATYEIDLSRANAQRLREAIAPWREHARKLNRRGRQIRRTDLGPTTQVMRKWAEQNGYPVSARGRIPADIREAYIKAHGNPRHHWI